MIRQMQNRRLLANNIINSSKTSLKNNRQVNNSRISSRKRDWQTIMLLGSLAATLLLATPAEAESSIANSLKLSPANLEMARLQDPAENTGNSVRFRPKLRGKETPINAKLIAAFMFGNSVIERLQEEAPNQEQPELRSQPYRDSEKSILPSQLASETVDRSTYLLLSLSERHLYLYKEGRMQGAYPVAIGKAGWETPTGIFTVIEKIDKPAWENPLTGAYIPAGPNNPLGSKWIGFWTDGNNDIGFHGTPNEGAIGWAVSHGCVRMRNRDIVALFDLVDVGTTVKVEP